MQWLIILVAFFLRLPFFTQSLWLDEAIEALALMGRQGPLMVYALADYQPPLYHFIAYAFTHLFGYSEIVLRLPSLLASLITVYFLIKIGELIGTKKLGYLAGLLAATNPLLIYYSQEGRTYALTACFASISFYYLIKLVRGNQVSLTTKLGYLLFSAAMIWTSYLAWYLLLAQFCYLLYLKRRDLAILTFVSAATIICWLPSFISSLGIGQSTLGLSAAWGRVVGGLTWKSLPLTWVKFNLGRITFASKYLYAAIVLSLLALHTYILKNTPLRKHNWLLLWLLVPLIMGIFTAIFLPVYSYFRVLFVLPAYLLLLALGLSKMPRIYSVIIVALNLVFLAIFWFSPTLHHEDWRKLTDDLRADPASQIALPSHEQNPGLLYYGISEQRIFEPKNTKPQSNHVYYIRYVEDLFDVGSVGSANLRQSGYTMTSQRVYTGIQVDIYENSH